MRKALANVVILDVREGDSANDDTARLIPSKIDALKFLGLRSNLLVVLTSEIFPRNTAIRSEPRPSLIASR